MPLADWTGVPIDAGLVMGVAFLGMGGSCFFPKGSLAGLALCSPCPPCSSLSDLCCLRRQTRHIRCKSYSCEKSRSDKRKRPFMSNYEKPMRRPWAVASLPIYCPSGVQDFRKQSLDMNPPEQLIFYLTNGSMSRRRCDSMV